MSCYEEEDDMMSIFGERSNIFCNNCRKYGHVFNKCKMAVVSYGVILYRHGTRGIEYLMICRRNTLGYIDFLRGKYTPNHKYYIINMLKQMTEEEIHDIETKPFDELWLQLWNEIAKDETEVTKREKVDKGGSAYNNQYKIEEHSSRIKFQALSGGVYQGSEFFTLKSLLEELKQKHILWKEPEWGFPKGRRHYQESEFHCALREFTEETGMPTQHISPIYNLFPVEEMFIGSNYKAYKHKYFVMFLNENISNSVEPTTQPYCSEVSQQCWKTLDECLAVIRNYNVEKRVLIQNVHRAILKYAPPRNKESPKD